MPWGGGGLQGLHGASARSEATSGRSLIMLLCGIMILLTLRSGRPSLLIQSHLLLLLTLGGDRKVGRPGVGRHRGHLSLGILRPSLIASHNPLDLTHPLYDIHVNARSLNLRRRKESTEEQLVITTDAEARVHPNFFRDSLRSSRPHLSRDIILLNL